MKRVSLLTRVGCHDDESGSQAKLYRNGNSAENKLHPGWSIESDGVEYLNRLKPEFFEFRFHF